MKVSELTGAELDAWVAKVEGIGADTHLRTVSICSAMGYSPSTNWSQGGPIIEREFMNVGPWNVHSETQKWQGSDFGGEFVHYGATFLEAGMRAYVASKFGDEVPDQELAS